MEQQTARGRRYDPRKGLLEGMKRGFRKFTMIHKEDGTCEYIEKLDLKDWKKVLQRMKGR